MSFAETIDLAFNAMDLIGACAVLAHSRYARRLMARCRDSCGACTERLCQSAAARELDRQCVVRGGAVMSIIYPEGEGGIIEPVPIDQTFVTHTRGIEDVGGGNICFWFCVQDGGASVIKLKPVIPLHCALVMSMHGTNALTRMVRDNPEFANKMALIG